MVRNALMGETRICASACLDSAEKIVNIVRKNIESRRTWREGGTEEGRKGLEFICSTLVKRYLVTCAYTR